MSFGIQDAQLVQAALLMINEELETMALNVTFDRPYLLDTASSRGANWRTIPSTSAPVIKTLADGTRVVTEEAVAGGDGYVWYRLSIGDQSGFVREDAISDFVPVQEGGINSPWLTADEVQQMITLENQRALKLDELAAISRAVAGILQAAKLRAG